MPLNRNDPTLDQLIIETGGQKLEGWTTSKVVRNLEMVPSYFEIGLTEKYPTAINKAVVQPGETCKVYLGNDLIMTGFIDQYRPSYDARTHFVQISGRSNTEEVVDSSFIMDQKTDWVFYGSLKSALTKILEKFSSKVQLQMTGEDVQIPVPFSVTPGQTVWAVIEELCRMCSRLVWDDENGHLVVGDVTKDDRAGSALVEGKNVETAAVLVDWTQRFYQIQVINSSAATVRDGQFNVSSLANAFDQELSSRPWRTKLVIMDADIGVNNEKAQQLANWMMNRLKGRSLFVQVGVTGWRDAAGKLWKPNTIVNVQLPELKINHDLVIAECRWERDENGTRTVMTCMPRDAFVPQPYIFRYGAGQAAPLTPNNNVPALNPENPPPT